MIVILDVVVVVMVIDAIWLLSDKMIMNISIIILVIIILLQYGTMAMNMCMNMKEYV